VMTGPEGEVIGYVTETRVTDADGRVIFRLNGPMQRRGLVVYLIFFSGKF
jgi:predicted metallo-beta-lactamase superfamily hydrolase